MTDETRMMRLWYFRDAPAEYQNLSRHGGDEDYVCFVPTGVEAPWWMEEDAATVFGCCSISVHKVEGGHIHIGAHA